MAAYIVAELCIGCGQCTSVCKQDAITLSIKEARVNPDKCVDCESCVFACLNGAITIV